MIIYEIIKLAISFILILVVLASFAAFTIYYRKYYIHMKAFHRDEWWKLMAKDRIVELAGEWERWPLGSSYFFSSVFKLGETYQDDKVKNYKRKTVNSFFLFIISFLLLLITAMLLPK